LLPDEIGRLQAISPKNEWVDVIPPANAFVVFVGDILEKWTSGVLRTTSRRVLRPQMAWYERGLSISFSSKPDWDALLVLPEWDSLLHDIVGMAEQSPFLCGAYILERMAADNTLTAF